MTDPAPDHTAPLGPLFVSGTAQRPGVRLSGGKSRLQYVQWGC